MTGRVAPPTAGEALQLDKLSTHKAGRLEIGMQAARGWSLSSSVVTTVLVVTLHPGLLVVLPITAVLGTIFAIKAVRGYKTARMEAARNEGVRIVATYLHQARLDASRATNNILRHSQSSIRDYYLDRAAELQATMRREQEATARAAKVDAGSVQRRTVETEHDLARVQNLLAAAKQRLGTGS
jgi:hypothetical protein